MGRLEYKCKQCGTEESDMWWKCCPKHCTEQGPDVVCDECAWKNHPGGDELKPQFDDKAVEAVRRNIFDREDTDPLRRDEDSS